MAEHEHLIRQLGLHLGHSSHYPQQLDPSLLSPVPRALARTELGLEPQALPFSGVDLWTGYELSWLDARGKPQVAVADFSVPCTTPDLIESKSFKFFLNSFNQSRYIDWQSLTASRWHNCRGSRLMNKRLILNITAITPACCAPIRSGWSTSVSIQICLNPTA